jgi:phage baseplate assembly protein W
MSLPPLPEITSRIDSAELTSIKNQFALRDRINADRYETTQLERRNPTILFDSTSRPSDLTQATLQGLKYPLELDGNGGLKLSSGYDRIGEQILEVLETRLGERVYRPFFGIPELLFETIDEYSLAQSIRSQLIAFLPSVPNIEVKVTLSEDGGAQIVVFYSVEGSESAMVRYSFSI